MYFHNCYINHQNFLLFLYKDFRELRYYKSV